MVGRRIYITPVGDTARLYFPAFALGTIYLEADAALVANGPRRT
jgi:hypothetical protein